MGGEGAAPARTPVARGFAVRTVAIGAGGGFVYRGTEWRDTLVVVERGEITLEWHGGSTRRFVIGDVLWLCGLTLRSLRNRGAEPTVLRCVSREGAGRDAHGDR
jgi:hypothetical protein